MQSQISMAHANLEKLRQNPYSGRGIVVGVNEASLHVQVYWLSGRSPNSQNRVMTAHEGKVFTEPANPKLVGDPSLTIYNAMLERSFPKDGTKLFAVTNGHQTNAIAVAPMGAEGFTDALNKWTYEPDKPNFTPRISAALYVWQSAEATRTTEMMSSIRKRSNADACEHHHKIVKSPLGFGHGLTTYRGDGNPLPSYRGGPFILPLHGGLENIAERYWDALNKETRVSIAVKGIDPQTFDSHVYIINRFKKVT